MQKNVEKKIPVYTHTHRWEGIEEIEETPKRSITGVKILIGVVFTITVGSILTTVQKLNLQLPNIPISIVDGEKAGSNDGMFFRINPGSNYEHIDYSNVTGQNDVVMKITAIDYKKKDKGGWGDGTMVQSNGEYLLMDTYHENCLPNVITYLKENGITIRWEGTGLEEKGYDAETGKMLVCVNPKWFRPTDVVNLWGDPSKAKAKLGWNPLKTTYEELIHIMAKHDRELAKREKMLNN